MLNPNPVSYGVGEREPDADSLLSPPAGKRSGVMDSMVMPSSYNK